MEIGINNYRSIKKINLKLNLNKINYFIGSNETGKSNVFHALRILGKKVQAIDEKDAILINKKHADLPFFTISDNYKTVYIDHFLNFKDSFLEKEKYLLWKKANYEVLSNINDPIIKRFLSSSDFYTSDEIKTVILALQKNGQLKIAFSLIQFYEQYVVCERFVSHYIEPIIKAKFIVNIRYYFQDLYNQDSIIYKIFYYFADHKDLNELLRLSKSYDDLTIYQAFSCNFFKKLNENIKNEFKSVQAIDGYPQLVQKGSKIHLFVASKNKYHVDNEDENYRSLGFKCFFRIILELIALANVDFKNEQILYLIDEPEQSLHPFLQQELLNKIEELLTLNKRLTVCIITHSPFCIKHNVPVFHLYRNQDKNSIHYGETLLDVLSNDHDYIKKEILSKIEELQDSFAHQLLLDAYLLFNKAKIIKSGKLDF